MSYCTGHGFSCSFFRYSCRCTCQKNETWRAQLEQDEQPKLSDVLESAFSRTAGAAKKLPSPRQPRDATDVPAMSDGETECAASQRSDRSRASALDDGLDYALIPEEAISELDDVSNTSEEEVDVQGETVHCTIYV